MTCLKVIFVSRYTKQIQCISTFIFIYICKWDNLYMYWCFCYQLNVLLCMFETVSTSDQGRLPQIVLYFLSLFGQGHAHAGFGHHFAPVVCLSVLFVWIFSVTLSHLNFFSKKFHEMESNLAKSIYIFKESYKVSTFRSDLWTNMTDMDYSCFWFADVQ